MATFAEEIINLADPTPHIFDPEDDVLTEKAANLIDTFAEEDEHAYSVSELRSQTAPLLEDIDERYTGRKVSRQSFEKAFLKTPEVNITNASQTLSDASDCGNDSDYSDSNVGDSSEVDSISETGNDVEAEQLDAFKKQLLSKTLDSEDNEEFSDEEAQGDNEEFSDEEAEEDNEEFSNEEAEEESEIEDGMKNDKDQQFAKIDVKSEIEKGNAIRAQQELWNKLCELRIRLQKLLTISNKLPQHDSWELFLENTGKEFATNVEKGYYGMRKMVNSLLDLQTQLLRKNSEMKNLVIDDNEANSDEEIPSNTDKEQTNENGEDVKPPGEPVRKSIKRPLEGEELEEVIQKRHASFIPYRNSVIQKWDEKTRLSGGMVSQKSFLAFENTTLKQIEQILQDKQRLIKRTQLKRSLYHILGKPEIEPEKEEPEKKEEHEVQSKHDLMLKDYDPEVFDDDDFYRQLLKDIIDSNSSGINTALLSKQLELQKLRKKMNVKKTVDTRASKGRKLKYSIHSKMVNFMAPVYENLMSEEARDNLFRSLYGQVNKL